MRLAFRTRQLVSRDAFQDLPRAGRVAPWHQRRTASNNSSKGGNESRANPVLEEYQRQRSSMPIEPMTAIPKPGDISPGSIFEDDRRLQQQRDDEDRLAATSGEGASSAADDDDGRNTRVMARVLDPDRNTRERWERARVVKMVQKNGRVKRAAVLARSERAHLVKSANFKTSVKKLGMLARQIQGKTIDDAIQQMRFSKKGVAVEVLAQLEAARDEAIVMRGMGLGKVAAPAAGAEGETETVPAAGETAVEIRLKDGKRHVVDDKSKIYIDQAWVGRGPYGQLPDYRARGRMFIMRTPWTSLSVLLKEEVTRVREHVEREAKQAKKRREKVWRPLPDRPIQIQRQWFSW